jgi:hypothetical protein
VRQPSPVVLTARRDLARRSSGPTRVEASILARLLGIRLLRIEASVAVIPAAVAPARTDLHGSPVPPPRRAAAPGAGLADAIRSIEEGAQLLAEARRNGA